MQHSSSTNAYDFAALSLTDLMEAREYYHLHLLNKKNVVATAVGLYRIRKEEPWPTKKDPHPDTSKFKKIPRTLGNSEVRPYSWPAILVFVEKMEQAEDLVGKEPSDLIPKAFYLPNGKAVPVCVVQAEKVTQTDNTIDVKKLRFPTNVISGGFPLLVNSQNQQRVASFGCLVTDGHTTYALTNRHVVGKPGSLISTLYGNAEQVVGVSADANLQLGKVPFHDAYPWMQDCKTYVNADVGLVEVNDLNQWKTTVLGLGQMEPLYDLNAMTFTLKLINQPVAAYSGITSQVLEGEIQALFYRFKSVNGLDYVSDFLVGPRTAGVPSSRADNQKRLTMSYGDSGSVLCIESSDGTAKTYHPLGLIWGMHEFIEGTDRSAQPYILASSLSTACRMLDLDIVRGWNLDLVDTWGEVGHFKVGGTACDLVSSTKLLKLLKANRDNIGYTDDALIKGNYVPGDEKGFVPLADVADVDWRNTRPNDSSNHFADIDETNDGVFNGETLLDLSLADDSNISLDFWLEYDNKFDQVDPNFKTDKKTGKKKLYPRRGALPFRVWQMYKQMVLSLKGFVSGDNKDGLLEFIVAGGTMSHYVGDACQPLHISYLHHGRNDSEYNVHSDYETTFVAKKAEPIFNAVSKYTKKVKTTELIDAKGLSAAKLVLKLMKRTITTLPPMTVLQSWLDHKGRGKWDGMWDDLGDDTGKVIADGSHTMAVLWQSAWKAGGGDKIALSKLKALDQTALQAKYKDNNFVPSYTMDQTDLYKSVL